MADTYPIRELISKPSSGGKMNLVTKELDWRFRYRVLDQFGSRIRESDWNKIEVHFRDRLLFVIAIADNSLDF